MAEPINPWLMNTVQQRYNNRQNQATDALTDAGALREMAGQYADLEPQTDLSALAALVDSWTGSKLANEYKPFTAKDKLDKIAAIRKLAGDTENAAMKVDTGNLALMAKLAGMDHSAKEAQQKWQNDNKVGNALQRDLGKIDTQLDPIKRDLQMLDEVYQEGDLSKITATLSNFAKGVGREAGVLTEGDLARVLPNTGLTTWEKLQSYLTNTRPKDINPEIYQGIKELTQQAKEGAYSVYQKHYKTLQKQYAGRRDAHDFMENGGGNDAVNASLDSLAQLRIHNADRPDDVPIRLWVGIEPQERDQLLALDPKARGKVVETMLKAKKAK